LAQALNWPFARRHLDRSEGRQVFRRPRQDRRGGGRSRNDIVAAALRHARAKYYLLLSEPFIGEEAAAMGLVSLAVESQALDAKAVEIASRLAEQAPARRVGPSTP